MKFATSLSQLNVAEWKKSTTTPGSSGSPRGPGLVELVVAVQAARRGFDVFHVDGLSTDVAFDHLSPQTQESLIRD